MYNNECFIIIYIYIINWTLQYCCSFLSISRKPLHFLTTADEYFSLSEEGEKKAWVNKKSILTSYVSLQVLFNMTTVIFEVFSAWFYFKSQSSAAEACFETLDSTLTSWMRLNVYCLVRRRTNHSVLAPRGGQ